MFYKQAGSSDAAFFKPVLQQFVGSRHNPWGFSDQLHVGAACRLNSARPAYC